MKISILNPQSGKSVELNDLIVKNSFELKTIVELDSLINKIGDAKYVLLGEASHGTHEYYTWRAQITRKLIEQKGFSFIAVEGDWPDCYKLNRYIKNYADAGKSAFDILQMFNRWPTWMWANWEIAALTEWLKKYNSKLATNRKVGFYGLDVYSLWESMDAIINYLDKKDKKTKEIALQARRCFEPYSVDEGQSYAQASSLLPISCEEEVIDLLIQIRKNLPIYNTDREAVMCAEQNASVIADAERYYRAMVKPGPASWNIRDHHMVSTLDKLMVFYGSHAKAIIWEHNTHIGDARFTDMAQQGMINVGQILNERHRKNVFSIGFGSYSGTVIAGYEWGDVMRVINVPDAKPNSWEFILHQLDAKDRIIIMTEEMKSKLGREILPHRAIGVVYNPQFEHLGNYVPSILPYRYDAFVYLDKSSALHPLHIKPDGHQMPETFPFGL